jgi:translation initiation factor 2 beta subunit (eIF-2beta)/eIF-5
MKHDDIDVIDILLNGYLSRSGLQDRIDALTNLYAQCPSTGSCFGLVR